MKHILLAIFAGLFKLTFAQQTIQFKITDASTNEVLPGATVSIPKSNLGAITNADGLAVIKDIPAGTHEVKITFVGYTDAFLTLSIPTRQQEPIQIALSSDGLLDEIIVEGTRGNKSISDTPTRTEALTDEIDEAAAMEPSKVSHLLTHTTGVNVQTTSATSNGAVIRIQGMNGRYTQLLKDGFPMYGGFSGSLDILTIPPLDLRQVEFIKGPASTLYGGGAIGGIVNLLSKNPSPDETLLHLNYSSIGARDFNAYVSRSIGKFSFTNLASFHNHLAYDADNDGFSDMASVAKYNFNPRFFYTPSEKWNFYWGFNLTNDSRNGGDMNLLRDEAFSVQNFYLDKQQSQRFTTQAKVIWQINARQSITIKNSMSYFERQLTIQENYTSMTRFKGQQRNSFSELSYTLSGKKHQLVSGLNYVTDHFHELSLSDDTLRNQYYSTYGLFVNEVVDITPKISLEAGFRGDWVGAESKRSISNNNLFLLPRLSTLFKITKNFSVRAGGGMGYRMPTIFNEDAEPIAFKNIEPIDFENVKAEKSIGANIDFKFVTNFGTDKLLLSLNQMFFYNVIDNPILLLNDGFGNLSFNNFGERTHSRGFETQVKFTFWKITWFLGYTYNEAFLETDAANYWLTLTPKHSIKGDFLFVEEDKWRIGLDYEYKSSQWLSNGSPTRAIFMSGLVVERTFGKLTIFVNAENYTDVRQSFYESLVSGPNNTTQLTEIWAPLDGRFFNGGIKIKL